MSTVDYASPAGMADRTWLQAWPVRRLVIAVAGCAVMAMSGTSLASYLDTSSATSAATATADVASLD